MRALRRTQEALRAHWSASQAAARVEFMGKQRRVEVYVATFAVSIVYEEAKLRDRVVVACYSDTVDMKLKSVRLIAMHETLRRRRAVWSERRLHQHQRPRARSVNPQTMHLQVGQAVEKALARLMHKHVANPCL